MFLIVPPLNPWDKPADEIMVHAGASTLAPTPAGAWQNHTRGKMDQVQFWFDRGYRVRRVTVELVDEEAIAREQGKAIKKLIAKARKEGKFPL